jgi:ABC-type antimicrobial peptide transport system permease subunit
MFKYALDLVFRRKLRTFLTSLGILIAVVLMSFILFGMSDLESLIVGQFSKQFKPNELYVGTQNFTAMMGSMATAPSKDQEVEDKVEVITEDIFNDVKNVDGVERVEPMIVINGVDLYLEGDDVAYPVAYPAGTNFKGDSHIYKELLSGDDLILDKGEVYVSSFVAEFYDLSYEDIIGKKVVLKSVTPGNVFSFASKSMMNKEYSFEIIGVVDTSNDVLFVNLEDSLEIVVDLGGYEDAQDYVETAGYYQLVVSTDIEKTSDIETLLTEGMKLSVISTKTLTGFVSMLTDSLTLALILFGAISALVASIGIINTMIMSIYEQTKEIGIIKAIGASNFQVMIIFLIQSALIGLIGGVLGLSFTYLVMKVSDPFIVTLLSNQGFTTDAFFHFRFDYSIYITLASIFVGILAGLYPAYKASRLDPVKALRYE